MSNPNALSFETTIMVRDTCLCLHLQRAARAVARRFDEALRPLGLTSGQFSLLMSLNRAEPPTIGHVAAEHLDRGIDGLELAAVSARDVSRAERAMAGFARPVPVVPLARLADAADIVVECAPAAVLRDIAEPALAAGRTLIVLSCGALLDNFDLVELARRQGGRILVPTGALVGLDAVPAPAV